jgi:alkylation response protein AidB-like acyl-CoA dehydrogenase
MSAPAAPAPGMQVEFSAAELEARAAFRAFVQEHVAPHAGAWDRAGRVPDALVDRLREQRLLGAPLSREWGGGGMDPVTYGLLTEEMGRGCSSVRSLLTVHDMVAQTLARWGSRELKETYLPRLARGELLGALALSEPEVGSDAAGVRTRARLEGDEYVLDGRKKWTTFGQIADLFLVLARSGEDQLTALLVPAGAPGLARRPLPEMVGTRASLLAEIGLEGCRVPRGHVLGRPGFGFSHVISTALDHGRYSVAWGAVGIAQACLDACLDYTARRTQFGAALREHQLVRRALSDMITEVRAARLLCCRAGHLRRGADPLATGETMIAKYFAARTAVRAAGDAVQLHGANGLSQEYPLERYLRDAKVTEIIEGSTQIQQDVIARFPPPEL